ncbi:acetyltransferase [Jeotgalibacillus aurantiacus]|uniref:acetyltransferase n=1 Tax=Jeotgalibacillus aurantiacus TaxID=2763266 RepID=UPI001D09D374|nr:acetyltransferase [Jeotgalibacillus aurantiacus]
MKLIIIGDGGHGKVVKEAAEAEGWTIHAVLDDQYQVPFLQEQISFAPIRMLKHYLQNDVKVVVAIGDNRIRRQLTEQFQLAEDQYAVIKHPSAEISTTASIGAGTVILAKVIVNQGTDIGHHVILNSGSIVEHDNKISSFVHMSPHAVTTGNVMVGEGTHMGASSVVIPGVKIRNWCTVGAGAVVIHSVESNQTVVGNPARVLHPFRKIQ